MCECHWQHAIKRYPCNFGAAIFLVFVSYMRAHTHLLALFLYSLIHSFLRRLLTDSLVASANGLTLVLGPSRRSIWLSDSFINFIFAYIERIDRVTMPAAQIAINSAGVRRVAGGLKNNIAFSTSTCVFACCAVTQPIAYSFTEFAHSFSRLLCN